MNVLISLVILLLVSSPVYSADICFPEAVAGKMITEIEKGRIDSDELGLTKKVLTEKETQMTSMEGQIKAKDSQINTCKGTVEELKELRVNDKKACDAAVSKAKPTLGQTILYTLGVVGMGIIIGLLL